jgi:hypothetical protein
MAKTDAEILSATQDAIFTIVSGAASSVSINGRSFGALDLDKLRNVERFYQARVARTGKSLFAVGKFMEVD